MRRPSSSPSGVRPFREVFRIERLVTARALRPYGYLGMAVVGAFSVFTTGLSTARLTAFGYLTQWSSFLALFLMFVGVWAAGRERAAGQSEITRTWPIRWGAQILARFMAAFIPTAGTLAVLYLAVWVLTWFHLGTVPAVAPFALAWLAGLVTMAFSLALAILVGTVARSQFIAFAAVAVIWAAATILIPVTVAGGRAGMQALDYTLSLAWHYSPVAGFAGELISLLVNRLETLFAGLGLVALAILFVRNRQGDRRGLAVTSVVAAVCLAVAGVGAGFLALGEVRRQQAYEAFRAGQDADVAFLKDEAAVPPAFEAASYDLSVDFDLARRAVRAMATVDLEPSAATLPTTLAFTLQSSFAIETIALDEARKPGGPDAALTGDLAFTRNGSYVGVSLPPGLTGARLTLTYSATIDQWRRAGFVSQLSMGPAVLPDLLWLPASFTWYPVPGWQPLASPEIRAGNDSFRQELGIRFDPADYRVTLTGLDGLTAVALPGLTATEGGSVLTGRCSGLSLLAGHYQRSSADGLTFYLSREYDQAGADRVAAAVTSDLAGMDKYLPPLASGATIIEWPTVLSGGSHSGAWAMPGTARLGDSLVASLAQGGRTDLRSSLGWWGYYTFSLELLSLHVPGLLSADSLQAFGGLALQEYLTALHELEDRGPAAYQTLIDARRNAAYGPGPSAPPMQGINARGPSIDPYVLALDAVYRAGGPEAVASVIAAAAPPGSNFISSAALQSAIEREAAKYGVADEAAAILANLPQVGAPQ